MSNIRKFINVYFLPVYWMVNIDDIKDIIFEDKGESEDG